MDGDRILKRLLTYDNATFDESTFNPLLNEVNANTVAKSLSRALNETTKADGCILKPKIRKNILEIIQSMCVRNVNPFTEDLLLNYFNTTYNKSRRKKKYIVDEVDDILNSLSLNDDLNRHYVRNCQLNLSEIELVNALLNIRSKTTDSILKIIVERCLESRDDSDYLTEFYNRILRDNVVSDHTNELIFDRLIPAYEIKFLTIASTIIEEKWTENSSQFIKRRIEHVVRLHIDLNTLIERMSKSQFVFNKIFYLLNDIFIKSHFNDAIQCLINTFVNALKTERSYSEIRSLYPNHLNNAVFYLETNPDVAKDTLQLYEHVIKTIDKLYRTSMTDFTLLMSHFPLWLNHFTNKPPVDVI